MFGVLELVILAGIFCLGIAGYGFVRNVVFNK